MGFSQVTICNMALMRLGVSQRIAAVNDRTPQARNAALVFDAMRDVVLEDVEWPFAGAYVDLALLEEEPNTEWGFSYAYPTDCLAARHLVNTSRTPPWPKFAIGQDGDDRVIWTDEGDATLHYTKRITDVNRFSATFADALAWRIAGELAMPLSVKPALADRAAQRYLLAIGKAASNALNESQDDDQADPEMISARG